MKDIWRIIKSDSLDSEDNGSIRKTSTRESLTEFMYRKISDLSVNLFCKQAVSSTVPISPNCQFKMVVHSMNPEVIVVFKVVGMPEYFLSAGKNDCMIAEKVGPNPKIWDCCLFYPCFDLWFAGYCAFESTKEASRYIVYNGKKLSFRKYDGTQEFKKQASFVFRKRKKDTVKRRTKSMTTRPVLMYKNSYERVRVSDDLLVSVSTSDNDIPKVVNDIEDRLFSLCYDACSETMDFCILKPNQSPLVVEEDVRWDKDVQNCACCADD